MVLSRDTDHIHVCQIRSIDGAQLVVTSESLLMDLGGRMVFASRRMKRSLTSPMLIGFTVTGPSMISEDLQFKKMIPLTSVW